MNKYNTFKESQRKEWKNLKEQKNIKVSQIRIKKVNNKMFQEVKEFRKIREA